MYGPMLDAVEGPVKRYYEGPGISMTLRALSQIDTLVQCTTCFVIVA